jgi:hypothetical protein
LIREGAVDRHLQRAFLEHSMSCSAKPKSSPRRLEELRRKMQDETYIAGAIQRNAQVLSAEIVNGYGVQDVGRKAR